MRRKTATSTIGVYVAVTLLPLALLISLAVMWGQRGPNPDYAFTAIITYFAAIALWIAIDLARRWWNRTHARPSQPPPAPMPAGVPIGPRYPAPLVAHA